MKINNYNVDSSKIFLRSSNKGVSYGGFHRKRIGAWNKCKNWRGIHTCGECGGFFGIDKKFHSFGITLHRSTVEMCEWRGNRIPIDHNKICVSEYRVVAIDEDIPDYIFNQCGYKVLKNGGYVNKISSGELIVFGGEIGRISGGYQYFYGKSYIGNTKISSGVQLFFDRSSAGNAEITGGGQYFYDESSAGEAEIANGFQYFCNKSSGGNAKITGGVQHFWDKSSIGNAKVSGGRQKSGNGPLSTKS